MARQPDQILEEVERPPVVRCADGVHRQWQWERDEAVEPVVERVAWEN